MSTLHIIDTATHETLVLASSSPFAQILGRMLNEIVGNFLFELQVPSHTNSAFMPSLHSAMSAPSRPSLPNDVLWKIALFCKNHLRLRLVSSAWNDGVINAHCDPHCGCKSCACTSTLAQFPTKRIFLPWIPKWNFTIGASTPSALLADMLFQRNQNGSHSLRVPTSFAGREIVPITTCTLEVSEATFHDVEGVFSTAQMQGLKKISVTVVVRDSLSAANKRKGVEVFGKLNQVEWFQLSDWDFGYNGNEGQNDFCRLISSFSHLKYLDAVNCGITNPGLAVFSSPSVSALEELLIISNPTITAAGICSSICSSPHLTNLNHLNLSDSNCGDEVVKALCRSPTITALRTLWLAGCNLHDASLDAMISSSNMKLIADLGIAGNQITSVGLASLLSSASQANSSFSHLAKLDAIHNIRISGRSLLSEVDRIFSPLSAMSLPQRASSFELFIGDGERFDHEAVEAMACIPLMQLVTDLDLSCKYEYASSVIFAPPSLCSSLQNFFLKAPRTTRHSLKHLTSSSLANNLHKLSFQTPLFRQVDGFAQHLDDNCCKLISDSEHLQNLEELHLAEPNMSVSIGLMCLLSSPNLPSLYHLDCNFRLDYSQVYAPTETMTEAEASVQIVDLLRSTATGITYLRFPNTIFAAAVRDIVKEAVPSVTIE